MTWKVFGEGREEGFPLVLGALKSNIGHTEGAAGVMGLVKAVMMLQRQQAPPSLHLRKLNPELELEGPCASHLKLNYQYTFHSLLLRQGAKLEVLCGRLWHVYADCHRGDPAEEGHGRVGGGVIVRLLWHQRTLCTGGTYR